MHSRDLAASQESQLRARPRVATESDWASKLGNRGVQRVLAAAPAARTMDEGVARALHAQGLGVARAPASPQELDQRFGDWKAGKSWNPGSGQVGLPGLVTDQGTPPQFDSAASFRLSLRVQVKDPDYLWNSTKYFFRKYGGKVL